MIVKNEEKVLPRILKPMKEIVDKILICDTGSTDRTKEIIREFTAEVYDFPWKNDFSAARNFISDGGGEFMNPSFPPGTSFILPYRLNIAK